MPVRRHVFVSGRVQGVYFRDNTSRLALRGGVTGWVRNLDDGRVEAVLEGDVTAVTSLVEWMHDGPPDATVDAVTVADQAPRGEPGFVIR